jgi:hypothetical protein
MTETCTDDNIIRNVEKYLDQRNNSGDGSLAFPRVIRAKHLAQQAIDWLTSDLKRGIFVFKQDKQDHFNMLLWDRNQKMAFRVFMGPRVHATRQAAGFDPVPQAFTEGFTTNERSNNPPHRDQSATLEDSIDRSKIPAKEANRFARQLIRIMEDDLDYVIETIQHGMTSSFCPCVDLLKKSTSSYKTLSDHFFNNVGEDPANLKGLIHSE